MEALLNKIDKTKSFSDIEERTHEAERALLSDISRVCRLYEVNGYFKGINEGIRMANLLKGKQIQVQDINTGEQIV